MNWFAIRLWPGEDAAMLVYLPVLVPHILSGVLVFPHILSGVLVFVDHPAGEGTSPHTSQLSPHSTA